MFPRLPAGATGQPGGTSPSSTRKSEEFIELGNTGRFNCGFRCNECCYVKADQLWDKYQEHNKQLYGTEIVCR